jgi:hypothetical protein
MGLRPSEVMKTLCGKLRLAGERKRLPHVGSQWGRRFRLPTERSRRLQWKRCFYPETNPPA